MPFATPGQTIVTRGKRRVVIGGSGAKTYADFQAHIATLAVDGTSPWNGSSVQGRTLTTATTATGNMSSSPWGPLSANGVRNGSHATCRVIQHSLPSQAEFDAQIAAGRQMLIERSPPAGDFSTISVDRNGYLSEVQSANAHFKVTLVLVWIGSDTGGSAFSMNPSTGTGPTPFVIP